MTCPLFRTIIFIKPHFAERTLEGKNLRNTENLSAAYRRSAETKRHHLHKSESSNFIGTDQKRGRPFEQEMDKQYLEQLINDYEAAIKQFKESDPPIPVIEINGDQEDFVISEAVSIELPIK
ncbi:deoxynucleoside kinase [Bacillus licheniformis]|nr:deoxynucleoside kinase [Bacillus licheniformis]